MIDSLIRHELDGLRDMDLWREKESEYEAQSAKLHRTIRLGNLAFRAEMESARASAENENKKTPS